MSQLAKYVVGSMYSLNEIKSLIPSLKTITSQRVPMGLIHLYRENETQKYWVGGPLQGPDTNFFLYLGEQTNRNRMLSDLRDSLSYVVRKEEDNPYTMRLHDNDWLDLFRDFDF